MSTVAIVGGGIAGLSLAHAIGRRNPDLDLLVLERSERFGGNIRSEYSDGFICEWGPDGFLDNAPDTLALVAEIGLESRLRPSEDAARRRFIFRNGQLQELPASPLAFARSGLLSAAGKARILLEPFARSRSVEDETIFDFAARRIGTEAASVMIDSMVSGIFAGNARTLSLRACFPKMWQLETDHGGLVRALIATRKRRRPGDAVAAPAGRLTSFAGGMEDLVRGLVRTLGRSVKTSATVRSIRKGRLSRSYQPGRPAPGYTLSTEIGTIEADVVVLGGPASETADLVASFDGALGAQLKAISTAPLAVVCVGYDEAAVVADRGALNGFGFLVPRSEKIRILGALWETSIYRNRAPAGQVLIRAMIGGAHDEDVIRLSDRELLQIVRADLRRTMGLSVRPDFVKIIRHLRGIPQYTVGHLARLERIESHLRLHPGLLLAGNSYRGVSINSCIAEAAPLAQRVLTCLAGAPREAQLTVQ